MVENTDGTVTDGCTSLMWQKDTADVSVDGTVDAADKVSWSGALQYCNISGQGPEADILSAPALDISDLALTLDSMENIRVEGLFKEKHQY